jgi:hypothetical protein
MQTWLSSNSQTVAAIVSIVNVALTFGTILVLAITWGAIRRQAKAAEDQASAARALTKVAKEQTKAAIEAAEAAREQAKLLPAQMEIARKQIHADRVAEIFKTLRRFANFVVHSGKVGPGKDFSEFGNLGLKGGTICQEYLDLQEAFYLSKMVSEPLFEFMKERMDEADGLQRISDQELFQKKLAEFHQNWSVYEIAAKLRELS